MTVLLESPRGAEAATNSVPAPLCVGVPADLARRNGLRRRLSRLKQRAALRASVPFSRMLGPRGQGFGILMYHRIADHTPGVAMPTHNVSQERFRSQLAGLIRKGYAPWPLRLVLDRVSAGEPIPRNVFVVTFDDGYECVFRRALPVLLELKVPATVFLATAYLGHDEPFPFDDWGGKGSARVATDSWRPLTLKQCRAMQSTGRIELGTHTHRHADFRGRPDELRFDLEESMDFLQAELGVRRPTFAFPYGTRSAGFSGPLLAEAARRAGVACSLTTEAQLARGDEDPFDWGRFDVDPRDTAATLAARLDGWFSLLRGVWRGATRNHG